MRVRRVWFGEGAAARVREILDRLGAGSLFLVTGERSFEASGAAGALAPAFSDRRVDRFCGFRLNPQMGDLREGLRRFREHPRDAVLAVGGGSALDMAKLISIFAVSEEDPGDLLGPDAGLSPRGVPLVAVPTTAGTGSEATCFAVLYIDGRKHSIDHPSLNPDFAVLDPVLTHSAPPRVTAVTGLDALCHAIESYWSVRSTTASRRTAYRAARLALEHLPDCVHRPDARRRAILCLAAHLAGRAIQTTRTTAPHALSYTLTADFGVPHGHAVALTLGEFILYNSQVSDSDVSDPRGADFVRSRVAELVRLLKGRDPAEARDRFVRLVRDCGLGSRLSDVGVLDDESRERIAAGVNARRLANNPRRLTPGQIRQVLEAVA